MYGVPDFYQNDNVKKGTGMQWRHQVVSDLPSNASAWQSVARPFSMPGFLTALRVYASFNTTTISHRIWTAATLEILNCPITS